MKNPEDLDPQMRMLTGLHRIYKQGELQVQDIRDLLRAVDQQSLLLMHMVGRGEQRPIPREILAVVERELVTRLGFDSLLAPLPEPEKPETTETTDDLDTNED